MSDTNGVRMAEELVVGHEYLLADGTAVEVAEIKGQEDWATVIVDKEGQRSPVKVTDLRHPPNSRVVKS